MRKKLFLLTALAGFAATAEPAAAQGLAQLLGGGGGGGDVTGDIFRVLQQRLTGQQSVPSLAPEVSVQNPMTYPQSGGQRSVVSTASLSPIERLMSARAGLPIRQFGYDVFGRGAPVVVRQSGSLGEDYVLGEGDEIVLTLHGQQNSSFRTKIDRDGRAVLPSLPAIPAAGRTFGEFRSDLEAAARQAMTGTEAIVSVGTVRQIAVRVTGEVNSPGLISVSGLATALDALSLAGGIKNTGSLRAVEIVRGGKVTRLDLYSLLSAQASGADIGLAEGDRIVVPLQTSAIGVVGQVKRQGIYELPPGQSALSIFEAMRLAGGTEVRGAYRYSILRTREDGKREMIQVASGAPANLQDGDILFVAPTSDVSLAKIELTGATAVNGTYPLATVRSLRGLLNSTDMFTPTIGKPLPYMLADAVIRLDPATLQRSVIPFSAIDVLDGKADLALQTNDQIYITNVAEMRYIAHRAADSQRTPVKRVNDHPDAGGKVTSPEAALASAVAGNGSNSQAADNAAAAAAPPADPRLAQLANLPGGANLAQLLGGGGAAPQGAAPANPSALLSQLNIPPYVAAAALSGLGQGQASQTEAQDQGPPRTDAERLYPGIRAPADALAVDDVENHIDGEDPSVRSLNSQTRVPRRDPQRLFIGLDDDTRRLLVSTLGNYTVTVVGEVNNPGDFLAMPETGLDRVVQAAGGLTPKVDLHSFEVTSAQIDNQSGLSRTVRRNYTLSPGQFSDVALKPFDRIRFNPVFSDRDAGDVSLVGEIKFPGGYEILRGEHLSSVLARAGGFTDTAYPSGVIFLRKSVAESERGVMQREADALEREVVALVGTVTNKTQINQAEIGYVTQMIARLRSGGDPTGRVAVTLDPKELATHPELDLVMEPGDQIFVPRRPSSVVVAGEVMSPGGIQFRTDRSVADYIALAGGSTEIADDDHIFVIGPDGTAQQVKGSSWLSDPPKLTPGSVVVVPRMLRHFAWDTVLEDVVEVGSQLAITAASLAIISR
jgi:protein involved in polysaccharide export with SLBB domain